MRVTRRLGDLAGYALHARDGEIGRLKEVYFDDSQWVVRYLVVHTGNWLLGRDVLIVPSVITAVDEEKECLEVDLTLEQIRGAPRVDTELPVSRHYEREYYRYYGLETYWNAFGPVPSPPPTHEGEPEPPEHPHLRSSDEVQGYAIHARDGEIGRVGDFILEDPDWAIRYLVVDTGGWLSHAYALLVPAWVQGVDWSAREVTVDLEREAIRTAPPYDPSRVISRDYEVSLYEHYGREYTER